MEKRKESRRDFLKTMGWGATAWAFGPFAAARSSSGPTTNVLFMAVDDLNDWTGCLGGHPNARTPHLDRLAEKGVLFTNAYCAAPACNPSRAALMTGIRPATSGVYHNNQPWRKSPVLQDAVTLPQHFMKHGYRAMGSGKIYHGSFPDPDSWHEYWPSQLMNKPPDPMPKTRPLNGIPKTAHFDWGAVDAKQEEMGDWQVADWVIDQLNREHEDPFFLACGFFRPHLPWYVPERYFDAFPLDSIELPNVKDDDLDDVPEMGKRMARPEGDHARVTAHDQWKRAVQGYLASILFVDECIGRVVDALEKSAYRDNTILVLWSDHGWHLGEKLHWRKFALWEEATHNVLLFWAPGVTQPGGRCPSPVSLLDIYPTLLDLCGLPPREELEGLSLLQLLKDPTSQRERPALTTHGRLNHSIRSLRWRYTRYADGTEELYDHQQDPMEWNNLASDPAHSEVKEELSKWLPKKDAPDSESRKKKKKKT